MAQPVPKVEVAFGYSPLNAAPVWTDVTAWAYAVSVRRGRQFELDRMEAGTCSITFEDDDRRFDPTNVASPYYPNVKPMVPVRITQTHGGVNYRRFTGFIERWPQTWEGGGDPRSVFVEVTATDLFKLLALRTLRSPYAEVVLADSPIAYFRMDDPGGYPMADASGHAVRATHFGGDADGNGAVLDEGTGWNYAGTGADYLWDGVGLANESFALEVWFKTSDQKTQAILESGDADFYAIQVLLVSGQPTLAVRNRENTIDIFIVSATDYADGNWHHLVGMYDATTRLVSLYVDNVLKDSATAPATINYKNMPMLVGDRYYTDATLRLNGSLDELAFYRGTLSAGQRAAHISARALRTGELSGARVNYILDKLSPTLARSVDAGQSVLGPAYGFAGQSMLEALLLITESEGGAFFMGADGTAMFFDRNDRVTAPKNAPQATLGDGGGTEVEYDSVEFSYDDERVFNDIRIDNTGGGVAVVTDPASAAEYGWRTLELTIEVTDDDSAIDRAYWSLSRYKRPTMRCERITLGRVNPDASWTALLAREVGDRLRVIRRPASGGATLTQDCFLEAVDESIDADGYVLSFQLSPATDWDVWLLGDSVFGVLGSTTRLGY
jgi:hypothetical protein